MCCFGILVLLFFFFPAAYGFAWGVDAAFAGDPFPVSSKLILRGRPARIANLVCAGFGALVASLAAYVVVVLGTLK
jgi:hypothetical protein